jgi:YbbR domain-containing protein
MAYHPFRDLPLKLVAVGLAALLWLTVARDPVVERGLQVPLQFENVPDDIVIVGEPPESVHVRARGTSSVLSGLAPGEVVAVLDLSSERPGERLFDIRPETIRAPFGVEVAQIVPGSISLTLERAAEARSVPVVPRLEGEPAAGYVVGNLTVDPPSVEVVGPESRLARLNEALTEPIPIDRATGTIEDRVTVGVADPLLRLRRPQDVRVVIDIVRAPVERKLYGIPVGVRGVEPSLNATIEPERIAVNVRGSPAAMRGLRTSAIEAYVDLAGLGSGSYNLPVTVKSGPELGVTEIEPPILRITLASR